MLGFPLTGVLFSADTATIHVAGRVVHFTVGMFFLFTAIYSCNALFDFSADRTNKRFSYATTCEKINYCITTVVLLVVSLAVLTILDRRVAFLAAFDFLFWFVYSYPVHGLKRHPFTGTIVHFITQIIHFYMGYMLFSPVTVHPLPIAVYFALLFAGGHLFHELIDYNADKRAVICTGAVFAGERIWLRVYLLFILAHGLYLPVLLLTNILSLIECMPFLTASILQIGTFISYTSIQKSGNTFFLRYRSLYRVYYSCAGLAFGVIKVMFL
jgi:4-hydroxybenzoate polyprenyltransferase